MHHIKVIKDGNVNNVVKEQLVDGVQYVDNEPHEGSLNGITSDAVAKFAGNVGEVKDVIPEGTTEENPLVNETRLGGISEVVAAALDDLDARIRAIEEAVSATNLGERTADSLDVQTLLIGGENVLDILNNNRSSNNI